MRPYTVFITPPAWDEVQDLPGHMRQRVRRTAESKILARPSEEEARDAQVRAASAEDERREPAREVRRIRLDRWRIVYAITESDQAIDVLAVRKRPPYDYGDLERLLSDR